MPDRKTGRAVIGPGNATGLLVASLALLSLNPGSVTAQTLSGKVVLEEIADYRCNYPTGYVDVVKGSGSIPLVLPKGDGPVQGTGSFTHQGTGYAFAGPLILEGELKNGILHFLFPKGYSNGQLVYNRNDPMTIAAEKDAKAETPIAAPVAGVSCSGFVTWHLTKPIETWRITIDDEGENVALTGSGKFDQAGLRVHTRRIVDVTIEKGKFKQGAGSASFVAMKSYSKPLGVYTCTPASVGIVGSGSDIEFERLDQTKWAARFNPPKTKEDAALKAQWSKIKQQNTPVIYPDKFAVQGQLSGKTLDLTLPKDSGYTVGIYCRLDAAIAKQAPSMRKESLDTERSALIRSFQVQLVDGWHHQESWSLTGPGLPPTSGTTDFLVRKTD